MAFTVEEFQDLLRLLDEHPDWQQELRRRLLVGELLELPALFRQMAERVDRLAEHTLQFAERMDRLTERMDQLTERIDQLTERMDRLTERMDRLTERMDQLTARMDQLTARMDQLTDRVDALIEAHRRSEQRLTALESLMAQSIAQTQEILGRVGDHSGMFLEQEYRNRFGARFSRIATRLRLIEQGRLGMLLQDAVEAGRLTDEEHEELLQTSVVLQGRMRDDGSEAFLAIEVSWGIGRDDIERAARRAGLIARLGRRGVPVVAGRWMDSAYDEMARARGVWRVLDGTANPPGA